MTAQPDDIQDSLNDRLRLILLLDAAEAADITPIPLMRLHALAFLANVLSPIWSVRSYDGKILKRRGGPFYPELQKEIDRLVGLGFIEVTDISYVQDEGQWGLSAAYVLRTKPAAPVIDFAQAFRTERETMEFLRRLTFAISRLKDPLERLVLFDATWSDKRTGVGDVIDFSEWREANYSAFAAQSFETLGPLGPKIGRGEQLPLYLRYLQRRAHGQN